jgi:hypothetical protein
VFFVRNTVKGGDWRAVLQKGPHAKHMVAEIEELLLKVDNNGEECGLVEDVGLTMILHHIGGKWVGGTCHKS